MVSHPVGVRRSTPENRSIQENEINDGTHQCQRLVLPGRPWQTWVWSLACAAADQRVFEGF
jgi:hypothetical protein